MDEPPSRAHDGELGCMPIALGDMISGADALLVVPPFARLDLPNLGVHLLQGCARRAGFQVSVLYAGMYLAREIGEAAYLALSESATTELIGERVFARAAYGVPLLGRRAADALDRVGLEGVLGGDALSRIAVHVEGFVDRLAAAIASLGARVVGCSAMFEQTAASVAVLSRVKRLAPSTVTLMGGPNGFGEMAEGIASISTEVDYVFAGESEAAFPAFLAGARPPGRVVEGAPCMDLDGLPLPDYGDFYRQRRACLGGGPAAEERLLLAYETSRGCWWGQKHHCTFCGVAVMRYRQKSPERVVLELTELLDEHPSRRVHLTDDIMPHTYHSTLIPRLAEELPGLTVFYEQKANLTLDRIVALRRAGVSIIQPGIEALSTPLLERMDKGLAARQNIALLRYARSVQTTLLWSLLYGLPGDRAEDYAHYPALLPLLRHLEPPRTFAPLLLFRFSPYGRTPERYGIRAVRPAAAYLDVLPEGARVADVAYVFEGEFESVVTSRPDLVAAIRDEVRAWNRAWTGRNTDLPALWMRAMAEDLYLLTDTRGLPGSTKVRPLSRRLAAAALVARKLSAPGDLESEMEWARKERYAVALDGWHVPLATAAPELLAAMEEDNAHEADDGLADDGLFDPPGASARAPLVSLASLRRRPSISRS